MHNSLLKSIYFFFSLAYGNLYIHYLVSLHHDHLICKLILPKKSFVFLNGERIACEEQTGTVTIFNIKALLINTLKVHLWSLGNKCFVNANMGGEVSDVESWMSSRLSKIAYLMLAVLIIKVKTQHF